MGTEGPGARRPDELMGELPGQSSAPGNWQLGPDGSSSPEKGNRGRGLHAPRCAPTSGPLSSAGASAPRRISRDASKALRVEGLTTFLSRSWTVEIVTIPNAETTRAAPRQYGLVEALIQSSDDPGEELSRQMELMEPC